MVNFQCCSGTSREKWPLRVRLEKVFPFVSNAPTLAFWLRDSKIDVLGPTVGEITWPSACEESWPRCPRAFCAYSCALGDECAARASSARSRRCARLCWACSLRNVRSCQAFCFWARGGFSLAHRIHQGTSSRLYGWRTRTASLKAAKLEAFPQLTQGTVKPACRGPAGVRLMPGLGVVLGQISGDTRGSCSRMVKGWHQC